MIHSKEEVLSAAIAYAKANLDPVFHNFQITLNEQPHEFFGQGLCVTGRHGADAFWQVTRFLEENRLKDTYYVWQKAMPRENHGHYTFSF